MANKFDFNKRIARLRKKLDGLKAGGILLIASEGFDANTYYYTGDETHPTMMFVSKNSSWMTSLHAEDFKNTFDECIPLQKAGESLKKLLKTTPGRLALDEYSPSAGRAFRTAIKLGKKTVCAGTELDELRLVKDPAERQLVRKACEITLKSIPNAGFAGKTEAVVAGEMELRARKLGGSMDAFPTMVLAGERSAFFHNTTSNKRIDRNEPVLIDAGARAGFYCGDYTRTYANGCRNAKFKDALEAVQQAKDACVRKTRAGTEIESLTAMAEAIITEHGFGRHSFRKAGLALGHHVGLNVHDGRMQKGKLRAGHCVTIEPGIYIPKEFGVRIEDTIVVG